MNATKSTFKAVHYPACFAAEGGPGWSPRYVDPALAIDDTTGSMSMICNETVWQIIDSQGAVYAEAHNPGDLADWWDEYVTALGAMHDRGEL